MEFLLESFPFVFGVLLGLTCERLGGLRSRTPLWGVGCVALGAFATLCTGEYRTSPVYFAYDIGLVAAVSLGTLALLAWRRRRRVRQ